MATGTSFDGQKSVRGSEEDFHIVCLPCYRDGDTIAAFGYCCQCQEHLCVSCFRYHKKSTPTRRHRLLDRDQMPDTQDIDTSIHPASLYNLTTPCPRHKHEMLKLYCHDHNMLLCGICLALDHTKQCLVAYIPDISEQIINSQEYESVVERIDKVLTECASIKDKTSEDAENSNSSMNEGLEYMRMLRQKLKDKFDKMEQDIEHKIQALKQQNEDRQDEDESICDGVIKRLTVVADSLNQLNASKQADLLFVELKQFLNQLQEYENSISLLSSKRPIESYKFVPSYMINEMLQSEESWGDLTAIQQQQEASTSDQQPDQARDQARQNNCQGQTASTPTQHQQRASTSDQHPGQVRDKTIQTHYQGQIVSTSKQQQKQPQRASTSDRHQNQAANPTNANRDGTQATSSSDQQKHHKREDQCTQTQAESTSSQQQAKTRDQAKPNNNGTLAASFSDQQQQGKSVAQTTPTPQDGQPTNWQALAAKFSSQQKKRP